MKEVVLNTGKSPLGALLSSEILKLPSVNPLMISIGQEYRSLRGNKTVSAYLSHNRRYSVFIILY